MRIAITGTPGTGKSTLAKALAKRIGYIYINEREFAVRNGIAKVDTETNELELPIGALGRALNSELRKRKNAVVEGHVICETRLAVDAVVVLRLHPEALEARLESKGWGAEKVLDNVFCEGIDYCKKQVLKNYKGKRVIEVNASCSKAETLNAVIAALGDLE